MLCARAHPPAHSRARGNPAGSPLSRRRAGYELLGLILAAGLVLPAAAQDANVGVLSGTLKKIKATGTITLGYRESSTPSNPAALAFSAAV